MFGFIRKWWRRRNRMYRCDDCGKTIKRSKERAAVRIEPVKLGVETKEMTKVLDRIPQLRIPPGMQRVVLSCPKCDDRRIRWDRVSRIMAAGKVSPEEHERVLHEEYPLLEGDALNQEYRRACEKYRAEKKDRFAIAFGGAA